MTKFTRLFLLLISTLMLFGFLCKKPNIKYDKTKEARGIWVTRWEWARDDLKNNPQAQQQRIIEIFDLVKKAKLNFILFQIRGNGDALYKSNFEPWSDLLTGTLGKDPGWDPLAFAVEQAHVRGLELHTWINTFPAWRGTTPPPHTTPEQVYNAHPDWIICNKDGTPMPLTSHYVNLSPGIPEVREYVKNVSLDIINNYDIDGFHFDYIRYPEESVERGYSRDAVSVKLFNTPVGNPDQLEWDDWQRENINQFVRKFYAAAVAVKPWLKISASVIGKYNYSEWNGYSAVYQDALCWVNEGSIDFICPMIYWQTTHPTAPFDKVAGEWLKEYNHQRFIFPGMSINRLGTPEWPLEEIAKQIVTARDGGNGMVFFSYSGLEAAMKKIDNQGFQYLANFPALPWKDKRPPMDPRNLRAELQASGSVLLTWSQPDSTLEPTDVFRYNIFRSEKTPVDIFKAENLIHITATVGTSFYDNTIQPNRTYYFVVTALDRLNNESTPSNEVQVVSTQIVAASISE